MADILLAEDDRAVRNSLVAVLEGAGHSVRAVRDGRKALERFLEKTPDLAILDVMMPVMDGREACIEMRKRDESVPILFLTALDSDADEVRGLAAGADDYISKTASDEILLARIGAALRRVMGPDVKGDFDFGPWKVHSARLSMTRKGCAAVELAEREVAILRTLAAHPGEVLNRDFLITRFWGAEDDTSDNTLSLAMFKLREKLGSEGDAICTIRGVGYAYRPKAR